VPIFPPFVPAKAGTQPNDMVIQYDIWVPAYAGTNGMDGRESNSLCVIAGLARRAEARSAKAGPGNS